jgi:DNA-binding transcriptional ArsR family regulator
MSVTRRRVLEELAEYSDARREETTTISTLVNTLEADEPAVEAHLAGLKACDLARSRSDGRVRVTVTGEELLELDTDEMVIVDSLGANSC